jgi:hypothetical protein
MPATRRTQIARMLPFQTKRNNRWKKDPGPNGRFANLLLTPIYVSDPSTGPLELELEFPAMLPAQPGVSLHCIHPRHRGVPSHE